MHLMVVLEQHSKRRVWQHLSYSSFNLNRVFSHAFHPLEAYPQPDILRRRRAFQGDNLNATELPSLQAEPIAEFDEKSVFCRINVFEAKRSGVNHLPCVAEKEHGSRRWFVT